MLEISLKFDQSGQYKIEYTTKDAWEEKVTGALVVWVVGNDFDGTVYRFNSLELITDKRTYKQGETAHVMLNTARAGTYVLFSDEIDSGTMLSYKEGERTQFLYRGNERV